MPALSSDPIEILIASDAWGSRLVLDACLPLTREQFHQQFAIGLGSLHETMTHIISVMRRWTDRIAERPVRPMLHVVPHLKNAVHEARDRTHAELRAMLDAAELDLVEVMNRVRAESRLDSTMFMDWPAGPGVTKRYTFTRGAVLVHLTTHGFHHRAQALNMLRQIGVPVPGVADGLPEPSVVDWQANTESPAVVVSQG